MSLNEKTAIVTGATRGIGKAIANELVAQRAFVIGTATTETGAQSISDSLGDGGAGFVLDVSDSSSIESFFDAIKELEAATILVNNAGITRDNLALRMKPEEWEEVINTNLSSVYRVTKKCLRAMTKARWGRIINISSVVGSMGNVGQSNYAAAKAGMEGYARALASELGSRNITVNCIAPGFISTDMTEQLSDEQKALLLAQVPAGRLGEGKEVAALAAFLASESAGYINGETIHINGGMYMA
ncbi:MAG TPA: 3-oxoacyl-ACP reductase FabG [Pseudomonadales bacterium]|jgi:3-oxoacyl-[acyl-carrier protein] reductase|nr:3-oxoacyl-ACP reductase FabG [Pseudomonadales bacterium]MDP7576723.1 3-oxoacyl-ACP reductase FabG [Pseudomonadales bacterium]HJL61449.1 3-oxoacyl-ACP reductase FabG [Pseudomonadales bacterium]HJP51863.1 3-oxoacyl-ACP reductase FabG [Pseudomonadales bacterium]|tara:strand:+ start:444 stop:1175 length:732 start_codon:yes stop_codon:yes gene_type:complete